MILRMSKVNKAISYLHKHKANSRGFSTYFRVLQNVYNIYYNYRMRFQKQRLPTKQYASFHLPEWKRTRYKTMKPEIESLLP